MTTAAAERFRDLAREFCGLIDRAGGEDRERFARDAYRLLAGMHAVALDLDWRAHADMSDEEEVPVAREYDAGAYSARSELLRTLLGDRDASFHVMYPYDDREAIENSLASDLADIDEDLRAGLDLADAGDLFGAEASWALNFGIHWGDHLVWALQPLHAWWKSQEEDADDSDTQ